MQHLAPALLLAGLPFDFFGYALPPEPERAVSERLHVAGRENERHDVLLHDREVVTNLTFAGDGKPSGVRRDLRHPVFHRVESRLGLFNPGHSSPAVVDVGRQGDAVLIHPAPLPHEDVDEGEALDDILREGPPVNLGLHEVLPSGPVVEILRLAPAVVLAPQIGIAQDVPALRPHRRDKDVLPGADPDDTEREQVVVWATELAGFPIDQRLDDPFTGAPEGHDVGMRGPIDAVGITGQLMVTVEVFMQADSLPQQRVAILCMTYAVSAVMAP